MQMKDCKPGVKVNLAKREAGDTDPPIETTGVIIGRKERTVLVAFDHWNRGHNNPADPLKIEHFDNRHWWVFPYQIEAIK